MSIEITLKKEEIPINDKAVLVLENKVEDYEWTEVTYKTKEKEIHIGSFFTDSIYGKEWMEYNQNYIVLMEEVYGYFDDNNYYDDDNYGYIGPGVLRMFDINIENFVEDNKEEMLEIYNREFTNENKVLIKNKLGS